MEKVSIRDAILANAFALSFFIIAAGIWGASATVKTSAKATVSPLPQFVGETLYNAGRCDLLRDSAVTCEKSFNQLATNSLTAQIDNDWTVVAFALLAIAVLAFNTWYLRAVRREMDALRSNSLMQPTGQNRPAADQER